MSILSVTNFSCGYSETPIVSKINLDIKPGKITVLLGPNGAGKTTLIRGMTRILKPLAGSITVNNENIWSMKPKAFSQKVARVSQFAEITWPFTVYDFVAMGRFPYTGYFSAISNHGKDIVDRALLETGLEHFQSRLINRLSGGEFQRATIARALVQEPDILILDEPVAHLDLHYKISIMKELQVISSVGKGICISLHDLNIASQFADYIYLLKDGSVFSYGTPDEVIQEPIISEVYNVDATIMQIDGRPFVIAK